MARNLDISKTQDSMHLLLEGEVVETGMDIFKPINSNPTSSRIENPFAAARIQYIQYKKVKKEREEEQR